MEDKKISSLDEAEKLEWLEQTFVDTNTFDNGWKETGIEMYSMYSGEQWTEEEMSVLDSRNQSSSVFNHISPAIDSVVGGERNNRPKVKMVGRNLDDEAIAEVKTSLYEYITYVNDTEDITDKMVLDALVTGRGYMLVEPKLKDDDTELSHTYLDFRDVFVDPYSRLDNLEDARFIHHSVFIDEDILKVNFPDYSGGEVENGNFFSTSEKDIFVMDNDGRKRVRLTSSWYKDEEGIIQMCIWVKGEMLYTRDEPLDNFNEYPLIQLTYKRTLDNVPYGLVKSMISAQNEINKRHSKALHYLNSRQVLAERSAFIDWDEAVKTLAKPDGITKLQDGALAEGRVQLVPTAQLADSQLNLMRVAEGKLLSSAGLNQSMVGQAEAQTSAKKDMQNNASASNTLMPFFNKIRKARFSLATKTMLLVPIYYTTKRVVKITKENNEFAYMPINEIQEIDGLYEMVNDVSNDDIDIFMEEAPTSLNEKREQFNQLLTIQGQTSRPIPMPILLRYSDIKNKYELAQEIEQYESQEAKLEQAGQSIEQLQEEIKRLGGVIEGQQSQIVQVNTAREVDKAVAKNEKDLGLNL